MAGPQDDRKNRCYSNLLKKFRYIKLFLSELMNAPHQLNEPLTYMPIPDSPYGWQEKMFSINSLEQNFAAYTGHGIRNGMEISCAIFLEAP